MSELKQRRDELIAQHHFARECHVRLFEAGDHEGSAVLYQLCCDLYDDFCRLDKMLFNGARA